MSPSPCTSLKLLRSVNKIAVAYCPYLQSARDLRGTPTADRVFVHREADHGSRCSAPAQKVCKQLLSTRTVNNERQFQIPDTVYWICAFHMSIRPCCIDNWRNKARTQAAVASSSVKFKRHQHTISSTSGKQSSTAMVPIDSRGMTSY